MFHLLMTSRAVPALDLYTVEPSSISASGEGYARQYKGQQTSRDIPKLASRTGCHEGGTVCLNECARTMKKPSRPPHPVSSAQGPQYNGR